MELLLSTFFDSDSKLIHLDFVPVLVHHPLRLAYTSILEDQLTCDDVKIGILASSSGSQSLLNEALVHPWLSCACRFQRKGSLNLPLVVLLLLRVSCHTLHINHLHVFGPPNKRNLHNLIKSVLNHGIVLTHSQIQSVIQWHRLQLGRKCKHFEMKTLRMISVEVHDGNFAFVSRSHHHHVSIS